MDAEDGLLGKKVHQTMEYDTLGEQSSKLAERKAQDEAKDSAIPGPAPSELIVVSSAAVGRRLLQTMGWREGTGSGPRVAALDHAKGDPCTTACFDDAIATCRQGHRSNGAAMPRRCGGG